MFRSASPEAFRFNVAISGLDKKISCLTNDYKSLFVGLMNGCITKYSLLPCPDEATEPKYELREECTKQLKKNEPIKSMRMIPTMNMLFALCGGRLHILDCRTLRDQLSLPQQEKISYFTLYENINPTPRLLVGHKRNCKIYEFAPRKIFTKSDERTEYVFPETPSAILWFQRRLFLAYKNRPLSILDEGDGNTPREIDCHCGDHPILKLLPQNRVLAFTKAGVAVILNSDGFPVAATLSFTSTPRFFGFSFPHIIASGRYSVDVESIQDCRHVGRLDLESRNIANKVHRECVALSDGIHDSDDFGDSRNPIFIATQHPNSVFQVVPIRIERQVGRLFDNGQVSEAEDFVKKYLSKETDESLKRAMLEMFHCSAGTVHFFGLRFAKAFEYFLKSEIDPRDIIAYFQSVQPTSFSGYVPDRLVNRSIKLLLDPPAPIIEANGQAEYLRALNELGKFLWLRRDKWSSLAHVAEVIDTTLLKIYITQNDSINMDKLVSEPNSVLLSDVEALLISQPRYHTLALLCISQGEDSRALDIYKNLGLGKCSELGFDGQRETIEFLRKCDDTKLIFGFSKWVLEKGDEKDAMRIFTDREGDLKLNEDDILRQLATIVPSSRALMLKLQYLEHCVSSSVGSQSQQCSFHTQLAECYVDNIISAIEEFKRNKGVWKAEKKRDHDRFVKDTREAFCVFLRNSTRYEPETVLKRIENTELHNECVVLLSHLKEHERALEKLIFDIKSLESAEQYCERNTNPDLPPEKQPFVLLLRLLFKPSNNRRPDTDAAIELLENHAHHIDPQAAMPLLPENVPIKNLLKYFRKMVPDTSLRKRQAGVSRALAQAEFAQVKFEHTKLAEQFVMMDQNRRCPECAEKFATSVAFHVFPSDLSVTHIKVECSGIHEKKLKL
eukprot:TRINITY_DN4940_c1_g1_i1.p1 TRINITY_DN4940_c1_g1~~TRINITY_DN4940_c1_g1_i1.p1  ORF type:complete len:899 (+),score=187.47 TRINITY_DN4940_c1_g1_i1:92-2788(+)